jgi:hypothetical protein
MGNSQKPQIVNTSYLIFILITTHKNGNKPFIKTFANLENQMSDKRLLRVRVGIFEIYHQKFRHLIENIVVH